MQAGGRRRDGAFFTGEHGLVVGAVALVDGAAAADIGRQRHVAALGQRVVERCAVKRKREGHLAALAFLLDRGVELFEEAHPAFGAEAHHVAGFQPLRRAHQRAPARSVEPPDERRRDGGLAIVFAATAEPAAVQIRRQHFGVVDDQRIAAAQQRRQVAMPRSSRSTGAPGRTTRRRAASRGVAGRSAMRSSGRAKSNSSVRMARQYGSSSCPLAGRSPTRGISQPLTRQSM